MMFDDTLISIHAPTRGATQAYHIAPYCQVHFNPRSHERSDHLFAKSTACLAISIHAPTRGATRWCIPFPWIGSISIHAPTRGATSNLSKVILEESISIHAPTRGATKLALVASAFDIFQSTLPREERRVYMLYREERNAISIHAPTRGATLESRL